MDVTLRELIYDPKFAGGIRGGHALKAVIPGGSSVPVLLPDQLDIPASFDGVAKAGSLLGSAGIIVMDETTCMVWAAENLLHFYKHESCGKCTPCREGGDWLHQHPAARSSAAKAQMRDLDLLLSVGQQHHGQDAVRVRRRGGDAGAVDRRSCSAPSTRRTSARAAARCRRRGAREPRARWRRTEPWRSLTPNSSRQLVVIGFTFFMLLNSAAVLVLHGAQGRGASCSSATARTWSGPQGLLQPLADIIKLMFKEELRPKAADTFLFYAGAGHLRRRRRSRRSPSCRSAPTRRSSACSTSRSSWRPPTSTSACS